MNSKNTLMTLTEILQNYWVIFSHVCLNLGTQVHTDKGPMQLIIQKKIMIFFSFNQRDGMNSLFIDRKYFSGERCGLSALFNLFLLHVFNIFLVHFN